MLHHTTHVSDVLWCYICTIKVSEGVILHKQFYRLWFWVFAIPKPRASFGRRPPIIAYLSTQRSAWLHSKYVNHALLWYSCIMKVPEEFSMYEQFYRLWFWVFAVPRLSAFNTHILIPLLLMVQRQIRAVSIVLFAELLIIIIIAFLVPFAIICLEVGIVLIGAV